MVLQGGFLLVFLFTWDRLTCLESSSIHGTVLAWSRLFSHPMEFLHGAKTCTGMFSAHCPPQIWLAGRSLRPTGTYSRFQAHSLPLCPCVDGPGEQHSTATTRMFEDR